MLFITKFSFAQSNSCCTMVDTNGYIKHYQEKTLKLHSDFWGNYQVLLNDKRYSTSKIHDLGYKFPSVMQEYKTYCQKKITSYCLIGAGVGLFIGGAKLTQVTDKPTYADIGFFTCMGSILASIYYYNSSYNNLSNSVWLYNQEIIRPDVSTCDSVQ